MRVGLTAEKQHGERGDLHEDGDVNPAGKRGAVLTTQPQCRQQADHRNHLQHDGDDMAIGKLVADVAVVSQFLEDLSQGLIGGGHCWAGDIAVAVSR